MDRSEAFERDTQFQSGRRAQGPQSQQHDWHETSKIHNGFIDQGMHQHASAKDLRAECFDRQATHRTEVQSWPLIKRIFVAGVISLYM